MLLAASCAVINPSPRPAGKLEILSHSITREDSGRVEVNATVKNVGSFTIDFTKVKEKFYNVVGTLARSEEHTSELQSH